jgi:TPR repeat protein
MMNDIEKMTATELWIYSTELKDKGEFEKSFNCMQKASDMGEMLATYYLATYYEQGIGVEKNLLKAAELYLSVVECREQLVFAGGNESLTPQCDAEFALGCMYESGILPNSSIKTAIDWYIRAINDGVLEIEVYLKMSEFYYNGNGVERDYNESAKYLDWGYNTVCGKDERILGLALKLADKDTYYKIQILEIIADCYRQGIGTEIDNEKANEYKEKATVLKVEEDNKIQEEYKQLLLKTPKEKAF